jgi:hypothetical protein
MFVQSAEFVRRHQRNPSTEISIYGQENIAETVRLGRMRRTVAGCWTRYRGLWMRLWRRLSGLKRLARKGMC